MIPGSRVVVKSRQLCESSACNRSASEFPSTLGYVSHNPCPVSSTGTLSIKKPDRLATQDLAGCFKLRREFSLALSNSWPHTALFSTHGSLSFACPLKLLLQNWSPAFLLLNLFSLLLIGVLLSQAPPPPQGWL